MTFRLLLALCFLVNSGCALLGGVKVESLGTSAQKPSNVAAMLSVSDGAEPTTELEAQNFRIYENEQLLSAEQTAQRLLSRDLVVTHHLLLLVDMSTATEAKAREAIAKAVAGFVQSARQHQPISVYAFDGSPAPKLVGEFPREVSNQAPDTSAVASFSPADSSRNLNGALLEALKALEARLMTEKKPLRVGSFVLFTRGPDLAGRASDDDIHAAFQRAKVDTVTILVAEETTSNLHLLGKQGVIRAESADTIPIAFEEAAMRVNAIFDRYYLIAYCSPARAGTRRLHIEVSYTNKEGEEKNGDFYSEFDATGFGPGCNSETLPRFVPTQSEAPKAAEAPAAPTAPSTPPPAPPPSTPGEPDNDENVQPRPAAK